MPSSKFFHLQEAGNLWLRMAQLLKYINVPAFNSVLLNYFFYKDKTKDIIQVDTENI